MLYVILMIMSYSHEIFYMPSVCTVGPKSLDSSFIDWSAFHFYETRRLYIVIWEGSGLVYMGSIFRTRTRKVDFLGGFLKV